MWWSYHFWISTNPADPAPFLLLEICTENSSKCTAANSYDSVCLHHFKKTRIRVPQLYLSNHGWIRVRRSHSLSWATKGTTNWLQVRITLALNSCIFNKSSVATSWYLCVALCSLNKNVKFSGIHWNPSLVPLRLVSWENISFPNGLRHA